jgi:hypothetical protein
MMFLLCFAFFLSVCAHVGSHHDHGHSHSHRGDENHAHDSDDHSHSHHGDENHAHDSNDHSHSHHHGSGGGGANGVPLPHPSAHLSRVTPPKTLNEKLLRAARDSFPLLEMKAIFEAGASHTARDPENGFTPLHWLANNAMDVSALPTWMYFMSQNPLIDSRDKDKATPLHRAAMNNCLAFGELLLEYGADINARDNFGFTPLMYTARFASVDMGLMLLEKGAFFYRADKSLKIKGAGELSPLQIAQDFVNEQPRLNKLISALEMAMDSTTDL